MLNQIKINLLLLNTVVLASLLGASTAHAFTDAEPSTGTKVLPAAVAPAPIPQLDTSPELTGALQSVAFAQTVFMPSARTLGFGAIGGHPGATSSARLAPAEPSELTTASVPSVTYSIRQDLPLFGAHRIRFGKIKSGVKISQLIRKAAASDSTQMCVGQCKTLAEKLTIEGAGIEEQLQHISSSVNRTIAYNTDTQMHGQIDYWSTPNETLRRGGGDCEDYAILKMALLSRLGVPLSSMEIVVVKDTSRRLFHAVLSVSMNGKSLILDNMADTVETDIAKWNYAPLFSISGQANYVFGYKSGQQKMVASIGEIMSVAPGAGF